MGVKLLTEEFANKVYDILVDEAGAREDERNEFIYHHCIDEFGCQEWRFRGKLGFGGKYKSTWNGVTYYPEDETDEKKEIKTRVDGLLKNIPS
jgi:hypothetical protein